MNQVEVGEDNENYQQVSTKDSDSFVINAHT